MKKAAYIFGALFSSLTLLGLLFKFMHWPGATIGLVFGVGGLALIFIPVYAVYRYGKS
ncbi:GldL-related protein [Salibacter halophilus]|uniref:GldL-related protein n=1 Tax=Salibacter halophilus TaxID=1803916 RepID=UPI001478B668|nr:hypothetical protein [Salibacter halophilus]